MKAEDIKVGMIVYEGGYRDREAIVLELPDSKDKVLCSWSHGSTGKLDLEDLTIVDPEADKELAVRVQAKIAEAGDAFEKAYQAFYEAQEMAYDTGLGLSEMKRRKLANVSTFYDLIVSRGWTISSLGC